MKKHLLMLVKSAVFLSCVLMIAQSASAASWTNWTSVRTGSAGSATGTITTGTGNVAVSLNGMINNFSDGDSYYNNYATGYTSPTGTYAGEIISDVIQEDAAGRVTLTFDQAVVNPYIALVSIGRSYLPVDYGFTGLTTPIQVLSYGSNLWGYTGYSVNNNIFSGREFNGILQLTGVFTSLTFSFSPAEYWHGFNVGIESIAQPTDPVPEPATMLLMGIGLTGLVARRKKKN